MLKLISLFCLVATVSFGQEEVVYLYNDVEFEEGSDQVLFGDNVLLRKKPNTEASVLDTLAIGTSITILKKSKETMQQNGVSWNWYKIKCNGQNGYVMGGLISIANATIDGEYYVTSVRKDEEQNQIFQLENQKPLRQLPF